MFKAHKIIFWVLSWSSWSFCFGGCLLDLIHFGFRWHSLIGFRLGWLGSFQRTFQENHPFFLISVLLGGSCRLRNTNRDSHREPLIRKWTHLQCIQIRTRFQSHPISWYLILHLILLFFFFLPIKECPPDLDHRKCHNKNLGIDCGKIHPSWIQ